MKRLTILALLVAAFSATAQTINPWKISAEKIDANNYYGITLANGMIGVVSSPEPFKVKEVVLAGAYDLYGRGRVSNFLKSFNLLNSYLEIDGKRIDAKSASNMKQELDMQHASFTTSFDYADKATVTAKGLTFEVPLSRVATTNDSVFLGVRPEKLRLDDTGVNSIKNCVVIDRSFVGTSTQYLVKSPWDLDLVVFEQNDEGLHDLRVGDTVSLEWDPEHTFALDGAGDINAGADLDDDE